MNFDPAAAKPHYGIIDAAGKFPIGTGNTSPTPEILAGSITPADSSITVGYSSPNITLRANATGMPTVPTNFMADTGSATPSVNVLNLLGGSNGIDTTASGNTVTFNFDVTEVPAIPTTVTTDSGTVTPTTNSFSILGRSGSKVSGSGAVVTVKSPPYADQGVGTVTLNSGSFVTGAVTITLPASAGLADGDLVEIIATNGIVTVQLVGTQVGHLGGDSTTAAGTFTGSATGDVLCLRYQSSTDDFWATSSIGVWVLA